MSDDNREFSLEDVDLDARRSEPRASGPSGDEAPAPLVVIEYRDRDWASALLPPVLVFLVALMILSYQAPSPDWYERLSGDVPKPPSPVAETSPGASSSDRLLAGRPAARPDAIVVRAERAPGSLLPDLVPPPPSAPDPRPARHPAIGFVPPQPSAEDIANDQDGLGHDTEPDADTAEPREPPREDEAGDDAEASERDDATDRPDGAETRVALGRARSPFELDRPRFDGPPPPPEPADIWADIRREAELAEAQRERLAELKPRLLEQERREAQRRQAEQATQARRRAEQDRGRFHEDLQQVLRTRGQVEHLARRILSLTEEYGRDAPRPLLERAGQVMRSRSAPRSRTGQVQYLRQMGLPETIILDHLAYQEAQHITKRGGPRSEADALVRAARQLLAVPIRAPQQSRPSDPPDDAGFDAAAHAAAGRGRGIDPTPRTVQARR